MADTSKQSALAFSADPFQSTFSFGDHAIRVIVRDGEPWFVAKDVMAALGYSGHSAPAKVCEHIPEEWKGVNPIHTPGGQQKLLSLSEPGLYFFLGRSDKQTALPFQKWVYGEVLPSIRKTGGYAKHTADADRIKQAFALAVEVAAVAANTVFDAVLQGGEISAQDRWMFGVTWGTSNQPSKPWAQPIKRNAMVASMTELSGRLLEKGSMLPTNQELADLAAACNQRLAQRMQHEASKSRSFVS